MMWEDILGVDHLKNTLFTILAQKLRAFSKLTSYLFTFEIVIVDSNF